MTKEFQTWDWFVQIDYREPFRIDVQTEQQIHDLCSKTHRPFIAVKIGDNAIQRNIDRIEHRPEQKPNRIMTLAELDGKLLEIFGKEST